MEVLNEDVLLTIILHTPIEDLNHFYDTNQRIKRVLNTPYTLKLLSQKYKIYHFDGMTFKDLLIEYFVLFFFPDFNESAYFEGELLRSAVVIRIKYLKSGDRIKHCDNQYSVEWICQAKAFLEIHGYQKEMDQVPTKKKQYKSWIDQLILKIVNRILSQQGVYTPMNKGKGFESMSVVTMNRWDDDSDDW